MVRLPWHLPIHTNLQRIVEQFLTKSSANRLRARVQGCLFCYIFKVRVLTTIQFLNSGFFTGEPCAQVLCFNAKYLWKAARILGHNMLARTRTRSPI